MIKVYLYIVVQTQHIGVQWSAGYKIVLSLALFKLEILDDLWITNKNKKNSKWLLTDEIRADKIVQNYRFGIGLEVTTNKKKFLDLWQNYGAIWRLAKLESTLQKLIKKALKKAVSLCYRLVNNRHMLCV